MAFNIQIDIKIRTPAKAKLEREKKQLLIVGRSEGSFFNLQT